MENFSLETHFLDLIFQESARTYKKIDPPVYFHDAVVKVHFYRIQKAFGIGIFATALCETVKEPSVPTSFTDSAPAEKSVDRTDNLVVVQCLNDRKREAPQCVENRRRNLVMDIMQMNNIWSFFLEQFIKLYSCFP
jgi:hypothetical protein